MFFVYVVAPAQSVVSRFAYKEDNSLESVAVQRDLGECGGATAHRRFTFATISF